MATIFKGYMDYSEFVHEMEVDGWHREQIAVDNTNASLALTFDLAAGGTDRVIEITCPPGRVMSVMGTQQVPAGADRGTAHGFWMRLASLEVEIHEMTHINIQKVTPSTAVVPLIKDIYQSMSICKQHNVYSASMMAGIGAGAAGAGVAGGVAVNNLYKGDQEIHRFRKGIVLYGQERLQIQAVNTVARPTNTITGTRVQFSIDMDLWTKTV